MNSNPPDVTQDHLGNPIPQVEGACTEHPRRIGRYRIEKVLGQGSFGIVYRAEDEQLNRPVALNVPHAKLSWRTQICFFWFSRIGWTTGRLA